MKKTICLILVLTLCASIFLGGCSGTDTKKEFCRVMCLYEDGMMVWIPDIGYVYVKHVDADLEIAIYRLLRKAKSFRCRRDGRNRKSV